jgi:SAM-dependent methyltransferase
MHGIEPKDGERAIDWSLASKDYALHRPGFPGSFFAKLKKLGVGSRGQRILDLGTGTGTLARKFASVGCQVAGVDIATGQIAEAKRLAQQERLTIDFKVCPAEAPEFPAGSFDVISASQCWLYFDHERTLSEVSQLLAPGGLLVTCHMCWLPRVGSIVAQTERLILKHNPDWSAADWDGVVPILPGWVDSQLSLEAMFYYDEEIPFTHESWRGRIRASRGISATLTAQQVSDFDSEHKSLLATSAPEDFRVLHRIDAHVLTLRDK